MIYISHSKGLTLVLVICIVDSVIWKKKSAGVVKLSLFLAFCFLRQQKLKILKRKAFCQQISKLKMFALSGDNIIFIYFSEFSSLQLVWVNSRNLADNAIKRYKTKIPFFLLFCPETFVLCAYLTLSEPGQQRKRKGGDEPVLDLES